MTDGLLNALRVAVSDGNLLTGEDAMERAVSSWGRLGAPLAVIRPRTTAEVSAILKVCSSARVPVTAWGGKTGAVQGTFADGIVALSLERMTAVEVDPLGAILTAEAGCTLQAAAEAAQNEALLLPLDLGARGSATLGGMVATNAGGSRVIRYGMTRNWVLGLEVVLADGSIVSSMNRLIKNNAGYDVKQLFIGSEGTLGVITRVVLRLQPLPSTQNTAFLGVETFAALPRLLRYLERGLSGGLSAFEVMWDDFHDLVTTPPSPFRPPLPARYPYYVLLEGEGVDENGDANQFEALLMDALAEGMASDAVIAKSRAQRDELWGLREDVGQIARLRPVFAFDVSLDVQDMEHYVTEVRAALKQQWPHVSLLVFGHLGDGNLHLVVSVGSRDPDVRRAIERIIYDALSTRNGSISAEHGIGLEKRDYLPWSRTPAEISLMRMLKGNLDPQNILNPGKVLIP